MKIDNIRARLKRSLTALAVFWITFSAFLYFAADFIIFKPSTQGVDISRIAKISKNYTIPEIYSDNNKTLKAFFLAQESDKILVYFHGNVGSNIHIVINKFFKNTDLNILVPTYFGYKPSTGKASKENFYLSADKTIEYLLKNGWQEEDIIVMGSSLGGAAASYIAAKYPKLNRTIIVNSFDSIISMCLEQYHIFCIFAKNIINSKKYAQNIAGKVFQFHSLQDETVPYELGRKLFLAIKSKDKKFIDLSGSHNDFSLDRIIKEAIEP
jgi:esterase/lipase